MTEFGALVHGYYVMHSFTPPGFQNVLEDIFACVKVLVGLKTRVT